jgi:hypothetical protein
MELDQDFKDFILLLNEYKVKYLVIGGYAVNFHEYPRYTYKSNIFKSYTNHGFRH